MKKTASSSSADHAITHQSGHLQTNPARGASLPPSRASSRVAEPLQEPLGEPGRKTQPPSTSPESETRTSETTALAAVHHVHPSPPFKHFINVMLHVRLFLHPAPPQPVFFRERVNALFCFPINFYNVNEVKQRAGKQKQKSGRPQVEAIRALIATRLSSRMKKNNSLPQGDILKAES